MTKLRDLLAKIIIVIVILAGLSQFAEAKSVKTRMIIVVETRMSVIVSPIKVINVSPIIAMRGLKRAGWRHTSTEHNHFLLKRGNKTTLINITGNRNISKIVHRALKKVAKMRTTLKRKALRRRK